MKPTLDESNNKSPAPADHAVSAVAPLLLTVPQAAQVLAIGRTSLYDLIDKRSIGVVRIGRSVRSRLLRSSCSSSRSALVGEALPSPNFPERFIA